MTAPAVFLGHRAGAKVFVLDGSPADDTRPIIFRISPRDLWPAGTGGDAAFERLFFNVTHSMGVTLRVTPVLDGVRLEDEATTVVLPARTAPTTEPVEISLGISGIRSTDGVTFGRFDLVGSAFTFELDTPLGTASGDLTVSEAVLEGVILRKSLSPA